MNSLERSLICKAGYDHGWEVVVEEVPERIILASALHRARATITASLAPAKWDVAFSSPALANELGRTSSLARKVNDGFGVLSEAGLGAILKQAARLARALPDEPCHRFAKAVADELASLGPVSSTTEIERTVRQRVGQNIYRESLMDYWGGACAVTGITVPELLRASHAKPWAACDNDAERLNVFNGFLLCAHLDALFDRHLLTFDLSGLAFFAPTITEEVKAQMGMTTVMRLRWLSSEHQPFLNVHRAAFEERYGGVRT